MYASQIAPPWEDKKDRRLLDIRLTLNQLDSGKIVSIDDKLFSE
jgi:hypothetical protein